VERQRYIDAARGTAMLFVLTVHFKEVYFLAPHDAHRGSPASA
jgi:surface polysaccharide O-acyltransferase-like enzyme